MRFRFNVTMDDKAYLEYNKFMLSKSYYGKKSANSLRITILLIMVIYLAVSLIISGFTLESFLSTVPLLACLTVLLFAVTLLLSLSVKFALKHQKTTGKMAYSPESVIEFYDEAFVEITPENKTENKYIAIEKIRVIENKNIYIHINNVMSYVLPVSCFESIEQYNEFLEFLATKCATIDRY